MLQSFFIFHETIGMFLDKNRLWSVILLRYLIIFLKVAPYI
jgi:hypothetical protein